MDGRATLWIVALAGSSVSIASTMFMVACYLCLRELDTFVFKLTALLAINDMGFAASALMAGEYGASRDNALCQAQAILNSYFGITSILWGMCIAVTIQRAFLSGEPMFFDRVQSGAVFCHYFLVAQVAPLVFVLLPLSTDSYGDASITWCWLQDSNTLDKLWRAISVSITWVAVVYCGVVYVRAVGKLKYISQFTREAHGSSGWNEVDGVPSRSSAFDAIEKLKYYPIMLVAGQVWGTVNRVVQIARGQPSQPLEVLQVLTQCLQGFFNFVPFVLTPVVGTALRRWWSGENAPGSEPWDEYDTPGGEPGLNADSEASYMSYFAEEKGSPVPGFGSGSRHGSFDSSQPSSSSLRTKSWETSLQSGRLSPPH